jgi:hypothetical protein
MIRRKFWFAADRYWKRYQNLPSSFLKRETPASYLKGVTIWIHAVEAFLMGCRLTYAPSQLGLILQNDERYKHPTSSYQEYGGLTKTAGPSLPECMRPENVAKELSLAFADIVRQDSNLVEQFEEAYRERGTMSGLPESRGGVEGLTKTLAGLFGMFPDELQEGSHATAANTGAANSRVQPFVLLFVAALDRLVQEHPSTLIAFKDHQQDDGRTTHQFMAALLKMYAQHEVGYPY